MSKAKLGALTRRCLITLLGIMLSGWGISTFVLGFVGEEAPAVITHVRREGGEIYDGSSGRYAYIVSYTFTLPDGQLVDGFTRKMGNGVYVKHPDIVTTVRYLKGYPALNFLESETRPNLGQLVLVVIGLWLMWVTNRSSGQLDTI